MATIDEIFADPATSTRNPALLAKRARVPLKVAQAFLRDLGPAQIARRASRPPQTAFAPTGGPHGEWIADTVYLRAYAGVNQKRGAIVTVLNPNTRYAYSRALVTDAGAENRGVSARKVAAAMDDILRQNAIDVNAGVAPILSLRTDGGPENRGELAALLAKRGIPQRSGDAGTHERMGRIDAFHRTLRFLIGDLFAATDAHVWYPHLDALMANYNNRPHRGLAAALGRPTTPASMTRDDEEEVRIADSEQAAAVRARTDASGVGPGSRVRLLVERTAEGKSKFVKGQTHSWSRDVYTVTTRSGPNSFTVEGATPRTWPLHALLPVSAATPDTAGKAGPKVGRKVVAAEAAEYRNISGVEQAAALAAPARARSERAARVDYARLARGN